MRKRIKHDFGRRFERILPQLDRGFCAGAARRHPPQVLLERRCGRVYHLETCVADAAARAAVEDVAHRDAVGVTCVAGPPNQGSSVD